MNLRTWLQCGVIFRLDFRIHLKLGKNSSPFYDSSAKAPLFLLLAMMHKKQNKLHATKKIYDEPTERLHDIPHDHICSSVLSSPSIKKTITFKWHAKTFLSIDD